MIEVGEYYRTKKGLIRKVETVRSGKRQFTITTETLINGKHKIEDIVKHSKNIIDLIEVGDYVNGEKINSFRTYDNKKHAVVENSEDQLEYCFDNEDIKSILTKEQYNANCYKVEE